MPDEEKSSSGGSSLPFIGSLIEAGLGIFGTIMSQGAYERGQAASLKTLDTASQRAADLIWGMFQTGRADTSAYREVGRNALKQLEFLTYGKNITDWDALDKQAKESAAGGGYTNIKNGWLLTDEEMKALGIDPREKMFGGGGELVSGWDINDHSSKTVASLTAEDFRDLVWTRLYPAVMSGKLTKEQAVSIDRIWGDQWVQAMEDAGVDPSIIQKSVNSQPTQDMFLQYMNEAKFDDKGLWVKGQVPPIHVGLLATPGGAKYTGRDATEYAVKGINAFTATVKDQVLPLVKNGSLTKDQANALIGNLFKEWSDNLGVMIADGDVIQQSITSQQGYLQAPGGWLDQINKMPFDAQGVYSGPDRTNYDPIVGWGIPIGQTKYSAPAGAAAATGGVGGTGGTAGGDGGGNVYTPSTTGSRLDVTGRAVQRQALPSTGGTGGNIYDRPKGLAITAGGVAPPTTATAGTPAQPGANIWNIDRGSYRGPGGAPGIVQPPAAAAQVGTGAAGPAPGANLRIQGTTLVDDAGYRLDLKALAQRAYLLGGGKLDAAGLRSSIDQAYRHYYGLGTGETIPGINAIWQQLGSINTSAWRAEADKMTDAQKSAVLARQAGDSYRPPQNVWNPQTNKWEKPATAAKSTTQSSTGGGGAYGIQDQTKGAGSNVYDVSTSGSRGIVQGRFDYYKNLTDQTNRQGQKDQIDEEIDQGGAGGGGGGGTGSESETGVPGWQLSPLYKFQLKEGERNIGRYLAARGLSKSSYGLNTLSKFQEGLSAQEAEKYYGRVAGLANMGMGTANQAAGAASSTGAQLGNVWLNQGNQASAIQQAGGATQANIWSGIPNIFSNAVSTYQNLKNV